MNVNACIDYVLALSTLSPLIKASHLSLYNYFHMDGGGLKKQVSSASLICHPKPDEWGSCSYACTLIHGFTRPIHYASWVHCKGEARFPAARDQIHHERLTVRQLLGNVSRRLHAAAGTQP